MMWKKGVPVPCPNCGRPFVSIYSSMVSIALNSRHTFKGNKEQCPHCKQFVEARFEGTEVPTPHGNRILPPGTTATPREVTTPYNDLDAIRFGIGAETPESLSWTLTREKGNEVYLICRELGADWKISLHKSGTDQIGFVKSDSQRTFENKSRHFFRATRHPPAAAHGSRVMIIEYDTGGKPLPSDALKPFKASRAPKLFEAPDGKFTFEIYLLENHPEAYEETAGFMGILVGLIKLSDNAWLAVTTESGNAFQLRESDSVAYELFDVTIGVTTKNTLYAGVRHKT